MTTSETFDLSIKGMAFQPLSTHGWTIIPPNKNKGLNRNI